MPLIEATDTWQSVVLTQDEIWQNRTASHAILTSVEAPTGPDDLRGIRLACSEVRVFRVGQTVHWKVEGIRIAPAREKVWISREAHQ